MTDKSIRAELLIERYDRAHRAFLQPGIVTDTEYQAIMDELAAAHKALHDAAAAGLERAED